MTEEMDAQGSLCPRMWETDYLGIKKLNDEAGIPERKSKGVAGYDLFSVEHQIMLP